MEAHRFKLTAPWRRMAIDSFKNLARANRAGTLSALPLETMQVQIDFLYECLWKRLSHHISAKVLPPLDLHFVWLFARANMSRISALMVIARHVLDDIERFRNRSGVCLLRHPSSGVFEVLVSEGENDVESNSESATREQGAYMFFDTEMQIWIRSGKASRAFFLRYKDHKRDSMLTSAAARKHKFYLSYPSMQSDKALHQNRIGWFDKLVMYCAMGYIPACNSEFLVDYKALFDWPKEVQQKLERQCVNKAARQARQLLLIDYSIELAYELLLAPMHNISQSEGYESFLKGKSSC